MWKDENWMTYPEYIEHLWERNNEHKAKHGENLWNDPDKRVYWLHMLYFNPDRFVPVLKELYSDTGRPIKQVDKVLRSWYLFMLTRAKEKTSLSAWVTKTKADGAYRTLIGCKDTDKPPEIASYYDLVDTLWAGDMARYSKDASWPTLKNFKKEVEIGEDQKAVDKDFKVEAMAAAFKSGQRLSYNYERYMQQFLSLVAVYPSVEYGIIPSTRVVAVDSTAYYEKANRFGKCACGKERMFCTYRSICGACASYSSPDATIGRDSGQNTFFYGQFLNLITVRNPELQKELVLSFMLADAPRHDSITFFPLFQEFYRNVPFLRLDYLVMDKAYDQLPIYDMLLSNGTIPCSPLRSDNGDNGLKLPDGITINDQSIPCCEGGHPMTLINNNEQTHCWEYGCPLRTGERKECPKAEACRYGKWDSPVLAIDPLSSDRLFGPVPRESKAYDEILKTRSHIERVNNLLLNTYGLSACWFRNAHHRSWVVALCCVENHIRAWISCGIKPGTGLADDMYRLILKEHEEFCSSLPVKTASEMQLIQKVSSSKGGTVNYERIVALLCNRNQEEKEADQIWFDMVKIARDRRLAENKEHKAGWKCPKQAMREREAKGQAAFEEIPPASPAKTLIPVCAIEELFVKTWEKTYVPYEEPCVILDPNGTFSPPPPENDPPEKDPPEKDPPENEPSAAAKAPEVIHRKIEGKQYNFVEVVIPQNKKGGKKKAKKKEGHRTFQGFTEAKPGVWIKPALKSTEIILGPAKIGDIQPSSTLLKGFKLFDPCLRPYFSDTFTLPKLSWIDMREIVHGYPFSKSSALSPTPDRKDGQPRDHLKVEAPSVPPAGDQNMRTLRDVYLQHGGKFPKLERNNLWRRQPVQYKYVEEKHAWFYGSSASYLKYWKDVAQAS